MGQYSLSLTPKVIVIVFAGLVGMLYFTSFFYLGDQQLPTSDFPGSEKVEDAKSKILKLVMNGVNDGTDNNTLIKQRAKAAVLGAFVADAATMGLHWIYDVNQITTLVNSRPDKEPEFFEPPSCPFYQYPSGALSPYGDEVLPLLTSLTEKGHFDGQHFVDTSAKFFEQYTGRLNHATSMLVQNVKAGKKYPKAGVNDDQAHGLVKVPVLVARYAGLPEFDSVVSDAVRSHQDNALSVKLSLAAAKILEQVVLGQTIEAALKWGVEWGHVDETAVKLLNSVFEMRATQHTAAVQRFGQSCHLPGSFQAPLHCALVSKDYVEAIRSNIMAGGDNCSRSHLVGALFAASQGIDVIPKEWRTKTAKFSELESLVDQLISQRPQV